MELSTSPTPHIHLTQPAALMLITCLRQFGKSLSPFHLKHSFFIVQNWILNNTMLVDLVFYVPYTIEFDSDRLDVIPWSTFIIQHFAFDIISLCDL